MSKRTVTFTEGDYRAALRAAGVDLAARCLECQSRVTWQPVWLLMWYEAYVPGADSVEWLLALSAELFASGGDASSPIWLCRVCNRGGALYRHLLTGERVTVTVPGWAVVPDDFSEEVARAGARGHGASAPRPRAAARSTHRRARR